MILSKDQVVKINTLLHTWTNEITHCRLENVFPVLRKLKYDAWWKTDGGWLNWFEPNMADESICNHGCLLLRQEGGINVHMSSWRYGPRFDFRPTTACKWTVPKSHRDFKEMAIFFLRMNSLSAGMWSEGVHTKTGIMALNEKKKNPKKTYERCQ